MKKFGVFWTLVISSLLTGSSGLAGGDVVNNGGGASELTVVYAYQNYAPLTEICARTASCHLSNAEKNLLMNLLSSLEIEQKTALTFQSQAILGEHLFRTGTSVGMTVEINKDRLWKTGAAGEVESYNLSNALELLTLAWSQHHPQFSLQLGASLAQKISDYALVGKASYLPYRFSSNLRLLIVQDLAVDQMYLEDGFDSFLSLHPLILSLLPCQATQLSVFTFQWSPQELHEDNFTRILANGRIGWKCQEDETHLQTASLSISLKIQPVAGKTSLKLVDQEIEMNLSDVN